MESPLEPHAKPGLVGTLDRPAHLRRGSTAARVDLDDPEIRCLPVSVLALALALLARGQHELHDDPRDGASGSRL